MPIRKQLAATFLEKVRSTDFWFHSVLYACLFVALLPITRWIAHSAEEQSRIFHALIVLVFACMLLVRFNGVEIKAPLSLNRSARSYLFAAYSLLMLGFLCRFIPIPQGGLFSLLLPAITIPAYCCAFGSLMLFTFGEGARRLTRTAAGTLCVFLLLSILMDPLDWPLRSLAGQWSGGILQMIGQSIEFALQKDPASGAPMLLLIVNEYPFHVASECNGFGVILTSLLISLLLAIYRKLGAIDFIINIAVGLVIGFAFNTLRIVIIVLLAPSLMEHYHLMHEIVGGISYWSCLAIIWLMLNGPIKDEPRLKETGTPSASSV